MLDQARAAGRGIGAFTCYDLVGLEAVIAAASARRAPVIALISPSSFAGDDGSRLARAFAAAAAAAPVDVVVQLDHCTDPQAIERVPADGLGAVLADGSHTPVAENLAFVQAARAAIGPLGLEAELGSVAGHEDRAAATTPEGTMTDPEEAARFAHAAGADCLAVAVGNVHGHYAGEPKLDWERLERLAEVVPVPLA
jgi:tagatose 1,6-diphosphate aldolase GatY/KbaY